MRLERNYESIVVKQLDSDSFTAIFVNDKIPSLFYGDYVEIDGERIELFDHDIFPNAMFLKGTGDFVGKRIVMDKRYFK